MKKLIEWLWWKHVATDREKLVVTYVRRNNPSFEEIKKYQKMLEEERQYKNDL